VTSNNYIACIHLASAFDAKGERAKALAYCRRAVEIHPIETTAGTNWPCCWPSKAGRRRPCPRPRLRSVWSLTLPPNHITNRGTIWQDLKREADAIADFEKTLQLDPEHVGARVNLGNLLAKAGKFDAAVRHYRAALQLDPDHALAHYDLANLLSRSGHPGEAIAHYERSLQLSPNSAPAHCNLGLVLLQTGRVNAALEHFRQALRLNPTLAQGHYGMALVLRQQGRAADAVTHLKRALQAPPGFPAALEELAKICATDPDPGVRNGAEAVAAAERLCKLAGNKNPLSLTTLAAAYAEAGNFSNAVVTAEQAGELARAAGQQEAAKQEQAAA